MDARKFQKELTKAKLMARVEPERQEYWRGYARGLRRGYYGEKFGTDEEYERWMAAADEMDESRQQRGKGYRDGLKFRKK